MRQKGRSRPSSERRRKGKSSRDGGGLSLRQAELNAVSQSTDCAHKDTSKGDIKSWCATPQCTTLMWNFSCFPVQGHLSETQKAEFFQNVLNNSVVGFFLVCSSTTWPGMERCSLKILPERATTLFLSFNLIFFPQSTTLQLSTSCGGEGASGWDPNVALTGDNT